MEKLMLLVLAVGVVLALLFGTYKYGRGVEVLAQAAANAKVIAKADKENKQLIQTLEAEREKHNSDLALIPRAPRVRIPTYRCKGSSTILSGLSNAAAERANDRSQKILDRITKRLESKSAEWSKALNACRVTTKWAIKQKPS